VTRREAAGYKLFVRICNLRRQVVEGNQTTSSP